MGCRPGAGETGDTNYRRVILADLHLDASGRPRDPLAAAAWELEGLQEHGARLVGGRPGLVRQLRVVRRSLDARRGRARICLRAEAFIPRAAAERLVRRGLAHLPPAPVSGPAPLRRRPPGPPPVVVGAGPAGLFAALTLAEAGWPPVVVERGEAVAPRARRVSQLYARGHLDPESNVCFGEGGAGTFSDGKLYTRVGGPLVASVLRTLVELGAPPRILVDARPHVGTDGLVRLLVAMRQRLLALGAEVRFGCRLTGLEVGAGRVHAIELASGERLAASRVVLATGHSACDVWRLVARAGLGLEPRPFAVGFRVEHPQELINRLRLGAARDCLPAADYRLAYNEHSPRARGAWSFCMCPGGVVVPTPTEPGRLCLNGMSHASRSGRFANSALVVGVDPTDLAAWGYRGALAGLALQRDLEAQAAAAGGGAFAAPACRLTDYLAGRAGSLPTSTSYRRGLAACDLGPLLPAPLAAALRRAIAAFGRQMPGFVTNEATLMAAETRTAAPVRLPRGPDLQALALQGLFPAGEGMGYGGGIVSAAVDGIRVARSIIAAAGLQGLAASTAGAAEQQP